MNQPTDDKHDNGTCVHSDSSCPALNGDAAQNPSPVTTEKQNIRVEVDGAHTPLAKVIETLRAQGDGQSGLVGRELDALIAERVFAHEIRVFDEPVGMMFAYHRRWVYNGEKYIWWEREGYQPEVYLPHYSTLMVDTILVLDQMRDKGFRLGVSPDSREQCSMCGSESKSYVVWFEKSSGDRAISNSMIAEAETLPEAICHAALAVHNDEEN